VTEAAAEEIAIRIKIRIAIRIMTVKGEVERAEVEAGSAAE
jgi:hypothetical protein